MNQDTNSLDSLVQEVLQSQLEKTNSLKVDPQVHRLILWANTNQDQEVFYTLRIGSQKFISLPSTDKKGQTYWLFKENGSYVDGKQLIKE